MKARPSLRYRVKAYICQLPKITMLKSYLHLIFNFLKSQSDLAKLKIWKFIVLQSLLILPVLRLFYMVWSEQKVLSFFLNSNQKSLVLMYYGQMILRNWKLTFYARINFLALPQVKHQNRNLGYASFQKLLR